MTLPTETMEIEEDDFTPLTMEEDLENLAENLDIGGYYCCDGRECGCNAESKLSVLKRFIREHLDKEKEKFHSELSLSQNRILEEVIEQVIDEIMKLPRVLVDVRMSPEDSHQYEPAVEIRDISLLRSRFKLITKKDN